MTAWIESGRHSLSDNLIGSWHDVGSIKSKPAA